MPNHVEVQGDASLIYSIFRNLIDNAIAYATGASRIAIVKNAVAVHGGTTTALSTPGGGLTIKFTLARF